MTATEAARNFSALLDAIEHDHDSVEITRAGRSVAVLTPPPAGNGAELLRVLREHPVDEDFEKDIREGLAFVVDQEPAWLD